jgi:hypothetical protein
MPEDDARVQGSSDFNVSITISGGSLCAGTCNETNGSAAWGKGSVDPTPTRRRQCALARTSTISQRYARPSRYPATSSAHKSRPPSVPANPRWLLMVRVSMYAR